jgi:hypothetical protein
MLELKTTLCAALLLTSVPATLSAQASRQEQLEGFAARHGCEVDAPLPNSDQYLVWLEYLFDMLTGAASPGAFADCPASPYSVLPEIFDTKIDQNGLIEQRQKLVALVNPDDGRIQQAYGAAEYVTYAYLTCQVDAACFAQVLAEDGYWDRICPDDTSNSPNTFELDLFENGGDMRYLLPYALTNCTLYDETSRDGTIFDVIDRILYSDDGRGGVVEPVAPDVAPDTGSESLLP